MILLAILRLASLIWAIDAQIYHGHNDLDIVPEGDPPVFKTPGQTYRIETGRDVILPCRIFPAGSYVLAWKRGIAVLTAGPVKVTPDPRVRLVPSPMSSPSVSGIPELSTGSYSLELKDVRPQDAGDYICQLGTMEPKEIVHTLEILVPPRITFVSHSGSVEVRQGSTVKMECRASGNPVPKVAWTRKNAMMPSGERIIMGLSFVIPQADRHSAGQYQCSADNGVGEPDTRHINVNVLYGPEVEPERPVVHTGVGLEAQLVCIVHAEPVPQVLWFKNTAQLGTTERHATHMRGNRYTLVIRNVTSADFGNYSCVASNPHGKGRGLLTLTGTPGLTEFYSANISSEKDSYNISWTANSHAPILEWRLYYRQQNHHHHVHRDNSTKLAFRSDWINIPIRIADVFSRQPMELASSIYPGISRQKMSYKITSLHPGTSYEARVQARNIHGWGKLSPIFHFTTRSNDMDNLVEPSAQPAVYGIGQQGMAPLSKGIREISSVISVVVSVLIIKFF